MKKIILLPLIFLLVGCPKIFHAQVPLEKVAYKTVVAAKAFTGSMKSQHPECEGGNSPAVLCIDLAKAISAKDSLIDAAEVYCGSASFDSGSTCTPPAKGAQQAADKLRAAMRMFSQTEADLKGAVK